MEQNEKLQEVYSSFFDSVMKPITSIYLDMELIQDFKLGALMTMVTVEEEIKYIQHRIEKYNERLTHECGKYFPVLKVSDLDISRRMKDPDYTELITTLAPFNTGYQALIHILGALNRHNDMTQHNVPIELTVNLYDVVYPDSLKVVFEQELKKYLNRISVSFVNEERYAYPDYSRFQVLMLHDLPEFVKADTNSSKDMFYKGKFTETKIFASMRQSVGVEIPEDKMDLAFDSTKKWLEMFCDKLVFLNDTLPVVNKQQDKPVDKQEE